MSQSSPPPVALAVGAGDATGAAIARMLPSQPRDAWTHELDLRPRLEKF